MIKAIDDIYNKIGEGFLYGGSGAIAVGLTQRKLIYAGALPNAKTLTVKHMLSLTELSKVTRLWGVARDPSTEETIPLPFIPTFDSTAGTGTSASAIRRGVRLDITSTEDLRIMTSNNRSSFTEAKVYVEYEVSASDYSQVPEDTNNINATKTRIKTIDIPELPGNDAKPFAHGLGLDVKNIVRIWGIARPKTLTSANPAGEIYPLSFIAEGAGSGRHIALRVTGESVEIRATHSSRSSLKGTVYIEYKDNTAPALPTQNIKAINLGVMKNTGSVNITHGLSLEELANITDMWGVAKSKALTVTPIPYAGATQAATANIGFLVSGANTITLRTNSDRTAASGTLYIAYNEPE